MKIELNVTGPSVEKVKAFVKRNREDIAEGLYTALRLYWAFSYPYSQPQYTHSHRHSHPCR